MQGTYQAVKYTTDKIGLGTVTVDEEDHTLGNMVRMQLLKDKSVRFAGYRKPHPLVNKIEIKCQTTADKKPEIAIQDACSELINTFDQIEAKFTQALSELPEAGIQMMHD